MNESDAAHQSYGPVPDKPAGDPETTAPIPPTSAADAIPPAGVTLPVEPAPPAGAVSAAGAGPSAAAGPSPSAPLTGSTGSFAPYAPPEASATPDRVAPAGAASAATSSANVTAAMPAGSAGPYGPVAANTPATTATGGVNPYVAGYGPTGPQGAPGAPTPAGWQQVDLGHGDPQPVPGQGGQLPPTSNTQMRNGGANNAHPQRFWLKLVAVAVVAGLASAGTTAGLLGAFTPTVKPSTLQGLGQPAAHPAGNTPAPKEWAGVVAAVAPAVVSIEVDGPKGREAGSGVIIQGDGTILTNAHVAGSGDNMRVTLSDGRMFDAKIVGTDAPTDLAVIRISNAPHDLVTASFGDSQKVTVGQPILAIGNPLGLANTATTGIVSATNRPVTTGTSVADLAVTNAIQIDAAINPGNSGGPLFDTNGKVIGIANSIATLSQSLQAQSGSIGLGFAIPANLATTVSKELIAHGKAVHGYLGVMPADAEATAEGQTRKVAEVSQVVPDGPAAVAGLQDKDGIVAVDGQLTPGAQALQALIRTYAPQAKVKLKVIRGDKVLDITVTLGTRPTS